MSSSHLVAALYHFVRLDDPVALQQVLVDKTAEHHIIGTLLVAGEGINGTIAGQPDDVHAFLQWLKADPRFAKLVHKESHADDKPFYRMRVKVKREIVTMGVPGTDPNHIVGTYVKPQEWNTLIARDDVIVVDTRNDYEVAIGTFAGAEDPDIKSFKAFPEWMDARIEQAKANGVDAPKIAMFCTGGIRCEKSTSYVKSKGVDEVFHLEGGILKYLEEVPEAESTWEGECFVFDQRVSVGHGLELGSYGLCFSCRRPLSDDDMERPEYEEGVSCHQCIDETTDKQKNAFRERQLQMRIAQRRGEDHVGCGADEMQQRRAEKEARKQRDRDLARASLKVPAAAAKETVKA